MRIFISAGEPSGDLHGANLVRALRAVQPDIECLGFGGEKMADAGCRLLYPLCQLAVMGFVRVFASAHKFLELLQQAKRSFSSARPDVVVLIDFPGFNWWIARLAHAQGIPVVYFVPPQIWAWARWRIRKMRRYVDFVLCTLPFEEEWYTARRVSARYLGHPFFDELPAQKLDEEFLLRMSEHGEKIIGLLPGSRGQEVRHNLPTLVEAARRIHAARPDTRFLVACFRDAHWEYVTRYLRERHASFIEPYLGKTPEIIQKSFACVAVSGSVGLELLYRAKPTVVVYRYQWYHVPVVAVLKKVKYISIVNLLAQSELFPEFLTVRCPAKEVSEQLIRWLDDPLAYEESCCRLQTLCNRVAETGACCRAAQFILDLISSKRHGTSIFELRSSAPISKLEEQASKRQKNAS
jgi:lipid-A-disaccharide synthase